MQSKFNFALLLVLWCVLTTPVVAAPNAGLPAPDEPIHLTSPRQAMATFFESARAGDYLRAARVLDLRGVPNGRQAAIGPTLAKRLLVVLDQTLKVELERLSDDPEGDPSDGARVDDVGTIALEGEAIPLQLIRVPTGEDERGWVVSQATVEHIPELYLQYGPSWLPELLPASFSETHVGELQLWQVVGLAGAIVLATLLAILLGWLGFRLGAFVAAHTRLEWDELLLRYMRGPIVLMLAIGIAELLFRSLELSVHAEELLAMGERLFFIVAVTWLMMRMVHFVSDLLEKQAGYSPEADALDTRARNIKTQVLVLRRVASITVAALGLAVALLQFEVVRTLGVSLLASAGVAGVVLGFAAQSSIGALLAGIQLSITRPFRIGDVVIVESEWGRIEEINLTYVVVKVWDERRLIIPMKRFLEEPFQNWTKFSPQLLGPIFLYADYSLSVTAVRAELERAVEEHPKWDRRVAKVQVTGLNDRTKELRILVSSTDASSVWELRCDIREHLIDWLQSLEDGKFLPRTRIDLSGGQLRDERELSYSRDSGWVPSSTAASQRR